jgi:hypothetical protein
MLGVGVRETCGWEVVAAHLAMNAFLKLLPFRHCDLKSFSLYCFLRYVTWQTGLVTLLELLSH